MLGLDANISRSNSLFRVHGDILWFNEGILIVLISEIEYVILP